jgi:hypothetical protein
MPQAVPHGPANAILHGDGESKCEAGLPLQLASNTSGLHIAIIRAGQIGGRGARVRYAVRETDNAESVLPELSTLSDDLMARWRKEWKLDQGLCEDRARL